MSWKMVVYSGCDSKTGWERMKKRRRLQGTETRSLYIHSSYPSHTRGRLAAWDPFTSNCPTTVVRPSGLMQHAAHAWCGATPFNPTWRFTRIQPQGSRALGRLGLARRDTRLVEGSAGLELVLWGFFSCTTGRHRTPKAWECQS